MEFEIKYPYWAYSMHLLGSLEKGLLVMDSFEWEVFKRTGKIDHYFLWKEAETNEEADYPLQTRLN